MKLRNTVILGVIFLILAAFIYFYEIKGKPKREEAQAKAERIFQFEKDRVKKFTLIRPDEVIICAKNAKGLWEINSPITTQGDSDAIGGLLISLQTSRIDRIISDKPTGLAEFGLAKPILGVALVTEKAAFDTLYLGDKSPTGSLVYARKSNQNNVFTVFSSLQTDLDKKIFDLRDKRAFVFARNQVNKITLQRGKEAIVVSKSGSEWQIESPVKAKADRDAIEDLLSSLWYGRSEEFVEEQPGDLSRYGIDKPWLSVRIWQTKDVEPKVLSIGKRKENRYYAKDGSRSPIFMVDTTFVFSWRKNLLDLRDKTIAQFDWERIDEFDIAASDSSLVCRKDPSGKWQIVAPLNRKADKWKIERILTTLRDLKAEKIVSEKVKKPAAYGFDRPVRTVKLWQNKKLILNILFGKRENSSLYVKSSEGDLVYLVSDSILNDLILKSDELVEKAPVKKGAKG